VLLPPALTNISPSQSTVLRLPRQWPVRSAGPLRSDSSKPQEMQCARIDVHGEGGPEARTGHATIVLAFRSEVHTHG